MKYSQNVHSYQLPASNFLLGYTEQQETYDVTFASCISDL